MTDQESDKPWGTLTDDELLQQWGKLAGELGLDKDHFIKLLSKQDDWTLVIKSCALIETALNHAFGMLFPEPVADVLRNQNLEPRRNLAVALKLMTTSQGNAIRELARLRNRFVVHKADGFTFTFEEHLKDKKQANMFVEGFTGVWPELPSGKPDRVTPVRDPQTTVTMAAVLAVDALLTLAKSYKENGFPK